MGTHYIDVYLDLQLHSNQKKIESNSARFKVIKAGKRFGKTLWALYALVKAAGRVPNGVFWYIAPTYGQAEDIAWKELKRLLPRMLIEKVLESKLTIKLKGIGSEIVLKGAENHDTLRGIDVDGVIFDEYAYMEDWIWGSIVSGQLVDGGFAYFISSPNRLGRNHFSSFCDKAKGRMGSGDKDWAYWFFTIYDNPLLSKEKIEETRRENSERNWRLEYLAEDSVIAGQIYSEFNWGRNVGNYDGEKQLIIGRAIDYGRAHPTVCLWFGVDEVEKKVYVMDEYVQVGNVIRENCKAIKLQEKGREIKWSVIDPSARKHDQVVEISLIDEFWDNGVECVAGDNTDRGYDITKMFLKSGVLKVDEGCRNLIHGLETVQYGDKENEDECDALRYGCVMVYDMYPIFREVIKDEDKGGVKVILSKENEKKELLKAVRNVNYFKSREDGHNFELPEWLRREVA